MADSADLKCKPGDRVSPARERQEECPAGASCLGDIYIYTRSKLEALTRIVIMCLLLSIPTFFGVYSCR